jgi:phospholipid-binding lipoprotein MlaA
MRRSAFVAVLGALVVSATPAVGAAAPAKSDHMAGDPWERINRVAYAFQNALDRLIIHPAANLFHALSPGPIGQGVHNVVVNLSEPVAFFNDVMQLKFKRAGVPVGRFVTNSTIGFLGLFDVAGHLGLQHHDNEFGVTLGHYGVGPGPYMYVPLVGPTTVRDLIGGGVDIVIDPFHWLGYTNRTEIGVTRALVGGLDTRVMTDAQMRALLSDATDPYATLRSVYLQNKQSEIQGGGVPVQSLPSFDDPAPAPPPPASAGATPIDGDAPPAPPATASNAAPAPSAPAIPTEAGAAAPSELPAGQVQTAEDRQAGDQ